jgi:CBS domain-containing protein
MLVVDVMTAPARTARPGTSVPQAMRVLRELRIAALPVVDASRRLVGIVTAADLLRAPAVRDPGTAPATVGAVMTRAVRTAAPGDDVAGVAQTMLLRDVASMPVTWGGRVVGMVARGDVVERVVRPDAVLSREVAAALRAGGLAAWSTAVEDGRALVWGGPDGERARVEAAAVPVPGVRHVRVRQQTRPWDGAARRAG